MVAVLFDIRVHCGSMADLFLRRAYAPDDVLGPLNADEVLENVPSADDCLSLRADDPFVPIERELDRNAALRDVLMRAFPWERADRYVRSRFVLFAGLVPMALLVVLDVELWLAGRAAAGGALLVDALSALVVAVDLARPRPRHPYVTVAAFAAAAMRLLQFTALRCGEGMLPWLAFALIGASAAVGTVVLSPTPRAVADHLRSALAMAPPTRLPPASSPGFYRYLFYAFGAAALLPALLWLLRTSATSLGLQLAVFVAFSLVIPYVGRVFVGKEPPVHRDLIAQMLGASLPLFHSNARALRRAIFRLTTVTVMSLVLSFAMVRGVQSAVDAAARTQVCLVGKTERLPALQRFVDAQRTEVAAARANKDASWLLLTVLVVPLAEELVYRGLVQHALRRRLKRRLALGVSAVLFGLAHVVAYHNAVYQPVLLGLSFGLAYERAGILASVLVHMLWNLWLSI